MKIFNLKTDSDLLNRLIASLDALKLIDEHKQLLNRILFKGALVHSVDKSASDKKCIIVLVYPKHMELLRQVLADSWIHTQLQDEYKMPVFFLSHVIYAFQKKKFCFFLSSSFLPLFTLIQ